MIIIEGPDNSGKTTLCNEIALHYGLDVRHSGGPGKDHDEIKSRTDNFLLFKDELCIRDRFPVISDKVYGTLLRAGNTYFTDDIYKRYMQKLIDGHPLIILCWPEFGTMMNLKTHQLGQFDNDDLLNGIKANQERIISMYDSLFKDIPHIKWSWETDSFFKIIPAISTQLMNMQKRAKA